MLDAQRTRPRRGTLVALLIGTLIALAGACAGRDEGVPAEEPASPRPGGTLVVGIASEPDSFNPYLARSRSAFTVANRVLPMLWRELPPDASGRARLEPELAAGPGELSEDRLTLRVPLAEGWAWEDGTPVTCEDLRFTLGIQKHPELGFRVLELKEHIVEIACPDPLTAVYSFDAPVPRPLEDVNDIHVLPRSLETIEPEAWGRTEWSRALVSAGPFRIASYMPGQEIVLEKNASYAGAPERPLLDRIVLRPVADSSTAVTQLMAGALDLVSGLQPDEARMLAANEDLRIEARPAWRYVFVGWNTVDPEAYAAYRARREASCARSGEAPCPDRVDDMVRLAEDHPHPLLGDARVRRALTLGIDRRLILDTLLLGEGDIPPSPILAPLPEHDASLEAWDYDPERAFELLSAAGFADEDQDGVLEKEGRPFVLSLWVRAGDKLRNDAAVLIKQNLAVLGVEVEIVPVDGSGFMGRLATRRMDAWILRWHVPPRVDVRYKLHREGSVSGGNFGLWIHPRADELASAAVAELDPAARADLWHEWEAIFHEQQPYTILFRDRELVGVRARVRGSESLTALDTLHGVEDWWILEP